MAHYFEKNEPNIRREVEKKCALCNKQFRIGRGEHQCKRCLRAICSDCGKEKISLFKTGFAKHPHRGCKLCVNEINAFQHYISNNQISFGKDSIIGEQWFKKIEKKSTFQAVERKKKNEFRRQLFGRMWDSYNYSMRQFVGQLTFQKHQEEIYQAVSGVIKAIYNVFPAESLQSVAYLSIFLLCFCSPEKAIIIALNLLQLKNQVTDSQALIDAYIKALDINKEPNIVKFTQQVSKKYINSLSINVAHINSSIYIIERIISRRKIEQVYTFMCLSIQQIKQEILKAKEDFSLCHLLLIRVCNENSISSKKQKTVSVQSSAFISNVPRESRPKQNSNSIENSLPSIGIDSSFTSHLQANKTDKSRSQGVKSYGNMSDSFGDQSAIGMLEEMKQLQKEGQHNFSDKGTILNMLLNVAGTNNHQKEEDPFQNFQEDEKSKFRSTTLTRKAFPKIQECLKCQKYQKQIDSLRQELKKNYRIADTAETLRQENVVLKNRLTKIEQEAKSRQSIQASARENILVMEKTELDGKLRRLKKALEESQAKEKQYEKVYQANEQNKKILKRQEAQINSLKLQHEQSELAIAILNNKLENQSNFDTAPRQSLSTEASFSDSRIVQMLKVNIKDKNSQIEQLTKKNKLLNYQIEQMSKANRRDSDSAGLKGKVQKLEREREGFMKKLDELSILVMEEEGEKLRLSEQNFDLRQILREKGIKIE